MRSYGRWDAQTDCGIGEFTMGDWMRTLLGWVAVSLLMVCACVSRAGAADAPLLVQQPTLSKTQIVFVYGGYLWSVPREGGEARQLTTGGHESRTRIFRRMENGSRLPDGTTGIWTLT